MPGEDAPENPHLESEPRLARRFAWVLGTLAVVLAAFAVVTGTSGMRALPEVPEGGKFELMPYINGGLWWATAVNALLCAVLALTARWWAKGTQARATKNPAALSTKALVIVVLILGAAGALRWPRMGLSFYNDEAHTFRTYIAGRYSQTREGKIKWKPVDWLSTVWLNEVGNNLMPCSVFGRFSYDAWRKITRSPLGFVNEAAVRFPSWVTGMLGLAALWLLARRVLPPSAAWWTLILGALHPWMVRYATEARGYGFLMLGVALAFYFLHRALEDNRWRWWIGFGLAQFLCLWGFPGAVYFLVVLDGLLMLHQCWCWRKGEGSGSVVLRPLVGMVIGGMVTLEVMLPSMLQLVGAMRVLDSLKRPMDWVWWTDTLGGLGFGIRGLDQDVTNPENLALSRMLGEQPLLWVVVVLAGFLSLLGTVELLRRPGISRIVALTGPLAILLSWVVMGAQGKYLHPWYLLYAAPGLVMALAAAMPWFEKWNEFGMRAVGKVSLPVLALTWFSLDLHYAHTGKENIRGLAETALGKKYGAGWVGGDPDRIFAAMLSDANVYDPWVRVIKMGSDLDGQINALIAEAREEKRPLYVSVGHVGIEDSPILLRRLKESGEFEPVALLWGMEEDQFTHHLFKLR